VECRRPGTLGAVSCAILQHGVEFGFFDREPIRCQSPCRQVTGGPGVVRMWWTVSWRTSRWTPAGRVRSGNSARMLSIGVPSVMVLTLGTSALAAWAGTDNDVIPSSSRLFRQSTKRPKWDRKSTPMMGCVTSATTYRHVKSRRRPKLRLRGSHS
jgi:hypothetical protein